MELSKEELAIIASLDDGSLYAEPDIVSQLFRYPHMRNPHLRVSRNHRGKVTGYLPVGYFYIDDTLSYIPAMPNSPPISATYPPGAEHVIATVDGGYFDTDIVARLPLTRYAPTASAYCLPRDRYFSYLSRSRRKDFRRKLADANKYWVRPGKFTDMNTAWRWMEQVWDNRGDRFGELSYDAYLDITLSWLAALHYSPRVTLKIDKYMLGDEMVGINCCAIHAYNGKMHCDDYLTWYDPEKASGLGIVSAILNLTNPALLGYRYNLGTPGLGKTYRGHEYKWAIIPQSLILPQSIISLS